ncbi:MAG: hypothetical protein EHM47_15045 [Ignavibacteriales bacterium]|nr:MAG: hypothetical protein EHM47_15045 [Ignavibacteriales bacterium]
MNLLRNTIEQTEEEFPEELEERIFHSLKKVDLKPMQNLIKSPAAIISYSFLVILILLNIYLLGRIGSYNEKMNAVENVVEKQDRMIELLFNSLPPTEVRAVNINNSILN